MKKKWIVFGPAAILGLILFIALGGIIVRELWNWLTPALFGWHQITFWQALGILLLCRILFGGLGHRHGGRGRAWRRAGNRWEALTPEERERFRETFRNRCGYGPAPPKENEG